MVASRTCTIATELCLGGGWGQECLSLNRQAYKNGYSYTVSRRPKDLQPVIKALILQSVVRPAAKTAAFIIWILTEEVFHFSLLFLP